MIGLKIAGSVNVNRRENRGTVEVAEVAEVAEIAEIAEEYSEIAEIAEIAPRPRGPCDTSPQSPHTRFHARAPLHGTRKGRAKRRKRKAQMPKGGPPCHEGATTGLLRGDL